MRKSFIVISLLLLSILSVEAKKVKGSVKCGKDALVGVIVTDGTNFTVTDSKGKFAFDAEDSADFIYLVTPSGYVGDWSKGSPVFYIPATEKKFDFQLQKYGEGADYSIVAIADPQTQTDKHMEKMLGEPMEDLAQTCKSLKNPGVGLVLGDICWDSLHQLPQFKEGILRTGIPFYPVVGNHDHNKDNKGDHETTAEYRANFGPENYAFGLGNDYVIVLDNIIYNTQKKYKEGYTDEIIDWVKGLLKFIPTTSKIYIAQHSPLYRWFKVAPYTVNSRRLLHALEGRDVLILSGHTHINNNFTYTEKIGEHNIAAFCGTWWIADHCNDGTPAGYKVYNYEDGDLTWYYKSIGYDRDFQVEFFNPGEVQARMNSIVVNVWDYDEKWSVEWFEDGVAKGPMEQIIALSPYFQREIKARYTDRGKAIPNYKKPRKNYHYFCATPSQYAKVVTVVVKDRFGNEWRHDYDMCKDYIDVQAHRGGAGLMPENTLEAMKLALDLGVNTLELDLQISQDGQVVVSHDPYFHSRYGVRPDGTHIKKEDPKEYLYQMPYEQIKKYDTGTRPSDVWPEKACLPTYKPLATELIAFVENYVKENNLSPVRYNIEVKSSAKKAEGEGWPHYEEFADKCIEILDSFDLGDRLVVQCFDVRTLNYMNEKYPHLILSYLVNAKAPSFEEYMAMLNFTPRWLSPHHSITDAELVRKCHEAGMKIVPWTADTPEDIQRLADLQVDAIISNYPDRVLAITRGY